MRISVDLDAKLVDVQGKLICFPALIDKAKEQHKDNYNGFDFFAMSVAEFLALQENRMPEKIKLILEDEKITFRTYIEIQNTFENGAKALQEVIERTTIEQSFKETAASVGLLELSAEESMLSFIRDYFGHPNFEESQKITLYEYIIARKVSYNRQKFEQNYNKQL